MEGNIRSLTWGTTSVYAWRYGRKSRKLHLRSLSTGQNLNFVQSSHVFHVIIIKLTLGRRY